MTSLADMASAADVQRMLLCATIAACALGVVARGARARRLAVPLEAAAFVLAAASWAYRWSYVGYVPLREMFDLLVFMGMIVLPLSWFARRMLGAGGPAAAMGIAIVLLIPPAFVFDAAPRSLPPALQSPLFLPHVAAYLLGYVVMAMAVVPAVAVLAGRGRTGGGPDVPQEVAMYRLVCLGFPLLTAGLILGAWWGKLAWGDWWNWDPKELWSLATWLIFVGYFHFRRMYHRRYARVNAAIVLAAVAGILITLLLVNLTKIFGGMHSYTS